ncbi:MAG: hypothetical protein V2I43_14625 [Parvularcula sp.]|jgi:hypothetical protein|nr:hypothetical protein [Parvularcula sp.]
MMRTTLAIAAIAGSVLLAGCGGGGDGASNTTRLTGVARSEAYCDREDLAPSKRHSYVVIDAATMKPAQSPEQFKEQNDFIRELLLSIVAPGRALPSGMVAPRERVSVVILPTNGSAGELIFTGCVPGLNADEQAKVRGETGAFDQFVSGDPLSEVAKDGDEFTATLLAALFASAGRLEETGEARRGSWVQSPVVQSLDASQQLLEPAQGMARRIFLVSDLSRFKFEDAEAEGSAKGQGLAAAKTVGQSLRFSEVYLIQPPGTPLKSKEFLDGFILGQGASLAYFGSSAPSVFTRPPVQSYEFAGRIDYDAGPESVQIVLARDDRNNLVYSYFALLGSNASVTPMTGTMVCASPEDCKVLSDKGGFAQTWKTSGGAEPEFSLDMPLAGARDFEFSIEGEALRGEVRDEALQLSSDPSKPGLKVSATQQ